MPKLVWHTAEGIRGEGSDEGLEGGGVGGDFFVGDFVVGEVAGKVAVVGGHVDESVT